MSPEILHHIHWLIVLVAAVAYSALEQFDIPKFCLQINRGRLQKLMPMISMQQRVWVPGRIFFIIVPACTGLVILVVYLYSSGFSRGFKSEVLTGLCFVKTAIGNSYLYE
ncbi:hypothetical protein [Ferruginibacter sp.]|uniref:hypothetical protein n=1 Tax=Ferruginibacter sp. TaxID=1940288 RepID=UPI00265886A0|nr:hypothetical protein [Ferruginibacter sp.]